MREITMSPFMDIFDCQQCRELEGICRVHTTLQNDMLREAVDLDEPAYDPHCVFCMRATWNNAKQETACPRHGGPAIVESQEETRKPKSKSSYNFPIGRATNQPAEPVPTTGEPKRESAGGYKICTLHGKALNNRHSQVCPEGEAPKRKKVEEEPFRLEDPKPEPKVETYIAYEDPELEAMALVLRTLKPFEKDEAALARILGYLADRLG